MEIVVEPPSSEPVRFTLDPVLFKLTWNGRRTSELTGKEFQILSLFRSYPGKALPSVQILRSVWGSEKVGIKTINVHFTNLRKKLDAVGLTIACTKGDGFLLQAK